MRMLLQKIVPAVAAAAALAACAIPDDGFSELKGTVLVPAEHLALVVHPGDADSDCPADAEGWGESPAIGDITPTVYVGIYERPVDPLNRGDVDLPADQTESEWFRGCGEIDADDNPVTPAEHRLMACPVGGATGEYVQTIAGTNGGAVFQFEALQLPKGNFHLFAWLDNRCAPDNVPSSNLVWDIGGPPGPLSGEVEEGADLAAVEEDENDLTLPVAIPVEIGEGGNELDDVLVLSSALTAASLN